jgi:TonB family protein
MHPIVLPPVDEVYYGANAHGRPPQGKVLVEICVGQNGRLTSGPKIVESSGDSSLDRAAIMYALATYHQTPPRGVPAGSCAVLPERFVSHLGK